MKQHQYLISTTAKQDCCPHCRRPILTALDEGQTARVDPTPLPDRQAEIAALLDGRRTYVHTANRHLVYRDASRITGNTIRGTIHAEHKCVGTKQTALF